MSLWKLHISIYVLTYFNYIFWSMKLDSFDSNAFTRQYLCLGMVNLSMIRICIPSTCLPLVALVSTGTLIFRMKGSHMVQVSGKHLLVVQEIQNQSFLVVFLQKKNIKWTISTFSIANVIGMYSFSMSLQKSSDKY